MSTFGTQTIMKAIGQMVIPCERCKRETAQTAFAWTRFLTVFRKRVLEIGKCHKVACASCGRCRTAVGTLKFRMIQLEILGHTPIRPVSAPHVPRTKAA